MPSKKRYPEQTCVNPVCRSLFIPHDKRQRFCTPQCNDNYNNDKRSLEQKDIKEWIKECIYMDNLLEGLYEMKGEGFNPTNLGMLTALDFDFSLASKEKSLQKGKETLWFIRYGLRPLEQDCYKIICRNEL